MSDNQGQNRPDQATKSGSPEYADRVYRSMPSVISGALMIALVLWLGIDSIVQGSSRAALEAAAAMLLLVPLLVGYTIWPSVRANATRMVVRNPLRTITVPWTDVDSLRAALSVEVRAGEKKFQIWALPVSLRQRKRENRRAMRSAADDSLQRPRRGRGFSAASAASAFPAGGPGLRSRMSRTDSAYGTATPNLAWADQVVSELNELRERAEAQPSAGGAVVVWTWWLIAPIVVGAVGLVVLFAS
jgi:hypothetical protein